MLIEERVQGSSTERGSVCFAGYCSEFSENSEVGVVAS